MYLKLFILHTTRISNLKKVKSVKNNETMEIFSLVNVLHFSFGLRVSETILNI